MSEIKVNKISPRTNCGTVTLGDSGDTITIPSGATINNQGTAVNFGATGSASWVTTVKTSTFTAVAGEGYFVNTTGGAVTVNLPAGTAGAVVAVKDYAGTFDTNAVTLVQNGSDKIGGSAVNATLSTEGLAVTLVFIDSTQGWLVTDNGTQDTAPTATFITATGGTITTSGNDKIHTFTGPGTFTVCSVASCAANNAVAYMVVAGGAGGGDSSGNSSNGGGGAGGFREGTTAPIVPYTASPLVAATGITVSATGFPITVGAGGSRGAGNSPDNTGGTGGVSTFSTITSAGGGGGGAHSPGVPSNGATGGSGGGGGASPAGSGGAGNTPPTSPAQGTAGSAASNCSPGWGGGGGGGATVAGGTSSPTVGGPGGNGATTSISASPTTYGGGGGGAITNSGEPDAGTGGSGGGGRGAYPSTPAVAGTINTGGGGGGAVNQNSSAAGGSGIVIIRYKFQ